MALTISRKPGQSFLIGGSVLVTVARGRRGRLVLRIDAPDDCPIFQSELVQGPSGHPDDGKEAKPAVQPDSKPSRRRGRIRPGSIPMPKLAPLAERTDALARSVRRRQQRRGGDFGSCSIAA
mgnify:CR=1 FL=1